ncbi:endonuclease [Bacteroidota bacterium]
MKTILLIISLCTASMHIIHAQIPEGYYGAAEGKTGKDLKSALYTIIKAHKTYPYSSSSTDTWDILKESDRDTGNAENVILFYTGWSVNADQEYNNGAGWNREHVWAKSRGDFQTSEGAGTDAHHLRPTDISVNAARDTRWFDTCSVPYLDGGKSTGCFTSGTRWVWQPRDEVKGDVARMIFYMATRYEGENGEPDLRVIDLLPVDDFTQEPVHAKLSALMAWHKEDSVNDFEINRNDVIYGFQHNRNPFIDHPEYVDDVWGPGAPSFDKKHFTSQLLIYPNPVSQYFTVTFHNPDHAAYRLILFDAAGRVRKIINNISGEIIVSGREDLPAGIYFIELRGPAVYTDKMIIK